MGFGLFHAGKFYFWGTRLGQIVIGLSRLKRKVNQAINLAAFLVAITGILALAWWFLEFSAHSSEPAILSFLFAKHPTLLVFWLSLPFDLFLIYRLSEDEAFKRKVNQVSYEDRNKDFVLPNSWQALRKWGGKKKIGVESGYNFRASKVVENAFLLADRLHCPEVRPMHLFCSLLADREVRVLFSRLNIDETALAEIVQHHLAAGENRQGRTELSREVREALVEGYLAAQELGQKRAKAVNLLLPLMAKDETIAEILYDQEIDRDKVANAVAWFRINERLIENYKEYRHMARFKPATNMDRAYTAVATPVLNSFAFDLTLAAKWFRLEFCVAREKEMEEIFSTLESGRPGVILVGETGVGKNTLIHGLAELMVKEAVPKQLQDKRLLELDVSRLVSGASPAAAQERLLTVLDEVNRAGNIVLFINNIETIVGISSGEEQSLDLADVLVAALEHRALTCFAAVTRENYLKYIEGKPLGEAMAKIEVKEPAGNQAIVIIESKIGYLENKYRAYFTYDAIEEAVKLSSRYLHDKYLPAKAIAILETLAARVSRSGNEGAVVTRAEVAEEVSRSTGIPVTKVTAEEGAELLNLEANIHAQMIDQEEAVRAVAAALRRARAQLSEGKRPIASFLFMGPTGVGKTELAKAVARVYFGSEKYMVRLDMSEYQAQDSISKMIGSSGTKGYLTEAVRQSPFCLLLLDEFEKAHPEILNLFLQVMDDGRLTDGSGHTIDFTNAIIIATSNAGALYIQEEIRKGSPIGEIKEVLINEHLNKIMRPELINRFDGVIVFKPLSPEDVLAITKLMIGKTAKTLDDKGIGLRLEEAGAARLAREGYDPKFGARPLRRLLQDKVENMIANKILSGELNRRDTVVIDAAGEVKVEKGREL